VDRDSSSLTNEALVQLRHPTGFRERQCVIISWTHGRNFVSVSGITAGRPEKAERLDERVLRDQEHESSGTFLCGAAYRATVGLVHDRDRADPGSPKVPLFMAGGRFDHTLKWRCFVTTGGMLLLPSDIYFDPIMDGLPSS
jgi:hypothetical protein